MTVSEAGTGSTASYDLVDGRLVAVSGAIPDTQAAPCWLALSQERSRRLRRQRRQRVDLGVRRRRRGGLTLVDARAGEVGPGSRPLDLTLDAAGRHLYAADRGNLVVAGFDVARRARSDRRRGLAARRSPPASRRTRQLG